MPKVKRTWNQWDIIRWTLSEVGENELADKIKQQSALSSLYVSRSYNSVELESEEVFKIELVEGLYKYGLKRPLRKRQTKSTRTIWQECLADKDKAKEMILESYRAKVSNYERLIWTNERDIERLQKTLANNKVRIEKAQAVLEEKKAELGLK